MAKRDPDIEAVEAEPVPETLPTAGERLRAAREQHKLSLEDIAAQTRIPQRHLASIETGEWDNLPAPTYTIGFAKNYAAIVGLDRAEIGDQLREEMGGQRFAATSADVFEPADPRRTMPKSLVIGAVVAAVLLIAVMSVLNRRSLDGPDQAATNAPVAAAPSTTTPAGPPAVNRAGQVPVVLTAVAPVWLQVSEKGGATLFSGMLQPGEAYPVPATATAPLLKTGKPEALKITVGNSVAASVGPPATTVTDVSLLPADLLKARPAVPAAAAAPASAPPPPPAPRIRRPRSSFSRSAAPPPEAETPPTTNTGQ
ncbi:helix-turn-helix domain-containing protein [Sphingomonas sp.]|uniref:helix-turn-helix domain-containing protein n=1 Tax=Sphingomonas sp. TaxID=28214 RepID=UPI00389EC00E